MSRFWIVLAMIGGCLGTSAVAAGWIVDPARSAIGFTATFENAPAAGVFRRFDASVQFAPDHPADSRIDVVIAIPSADMSSAEINDAIRGPDWFDATRFPVAEFHSTQVRSAGGDRYLAVGTLAVKGRTKPVEVPFRWKADGDLATMDGELTLDRGAFGIGLGEWRSSKVVGASVVVRFSLHLRKGG
ncbi:MAG: YceI family protein [Betaproteobacteria bacterium]|nr:YceI family protein [Betaproteobacteria bacterium]MDE2002778.1 YceI family protein [Betaproteobacteria bacterium]